MSGGGRGRAAEIYHITVVIHYDFKYNNQIDLSLLWMIHEASKIAPDKKKSDMQGQASSSSIQCHNCALFGHKSPECKFPKRKCVKCDKLGHLAKFCGINPVKSEPTKKPVGASAKENEDLVEPCISSETLSLDDGDLEVVEGYVGDQRVRVLKDSGCSGIVSNDKLVKLDEFVGTHATMVLMNGNREEVQRVNIKIDTTYVSGTVKAYSMKDCIYDLIVGSAKSVDKSMYPVDGVGEVTTRAQAAASKKPKVSAKDKRDH